MPQWDGGIKEPHVAPDPWYGPLQHGNNTLKCKNGIKKGGLCNKNFNGKKSFSAYF